MKETQEILLFDGAFGTYYSKLTGKDIPCELANICEPETVLAIHKEYIEAGAMAIKTNTFAANFQQFNKKTLEQIIDQGYRLAVQAAGSSVQVFADLGPAHSENPLQDYLWLIDRFLSLGAEKFLFETFDDSSDLLKAVDYLAARKKDAVILVSFAVAQDGYTSSGLYYRPLLQTFLAHPAVYAAGLNCVCGPAHLSQLIQQYNWPADGKLSVMPNSGYPDLVGNRRVYIDNAEYFADKLLTLTQSGVSILGGCCGTTPAHIREAAQRLRNVSMQKAAEKETISKPPSVPDSNSFFEKLSAGKKVIAVELDPPNSLDFDESLLHAAKLKEAGADIITFADSPLAKARMDNFMFSARIRRELNIEVLPHLTCRDRNLISVKGVLLGGKMEHINNVLVVTGDRITAEDRQDIKGVFSLNSQKLIQYIHNLNQELFTESPYQIGGALNISLPNFDAELTKAQAKIDAGAAYLLTQPIFGPEGVQNLKKAKEQLNCKILGGILPLASYRNALFMNNEVPGIQIPEDILRRLSDKTPEEFAEVSAEISLEIARTIAPYCDGFYFIIPLKRTELICSILKKLKEGASDL